MATKSQSRGNDLSGGGAVSPLREIIDHQTLRRMAGGRSFERGEDYFVGGRVSDLTENRGKIVADVHGTRTYRVALWAENGAL